MLRIQLLCCLWIVNIIFCCSSGDSCICLPPVTYVSIPHSSLFHRPEVSHTQLQTRKMGVGGALNIQQWMQLFIESCSISSLFVGNQIWNNHTYSSDHLIKSFLLFSTSWSTWVQCLCYRGDLYNLWTLHRKKKLL